MELEKKVGDSGLLKGGSPSGGPWWVVVGEERGHAKKLNPVGFMLDYYGGDERGGEGGGEKHEIQRMVKLPWR